MSAFKPMVIATLVLSLVQPLSSLAAGFDPEMISPNHGAPPTSGEMVADMLVARPLYAAATVFGTAVFLVSLPFSALGGNVDQAASELVTGPARGLLTRCLGCTQTTQDSNVERPLK